MARKRTKPRRKKRNWTQIILWVISFLVVISMAIGYVLIAMPTPTPPGTPVP